MNEAVPNCAVGDGLTWRVGMRQQVFRRPRRDSNAEPADSKSDALSN